MQSGLSMYSLIILSLKESDYIFHLFLMNALGLVGCRIPSCSYEQFSDSPNITFLHKLCCIFLIVITSHNAKRCLDSFLYIYATGGQMCVTLWLDVSQRFNKWPYLNYSPYLLCCLLALSIHGSINSYLGCNNS